MNPVKNQSYSNYLLTSAIFGFLAVAIGAFGAHALKGIVGPERMPIFETGNRYHFYHTIVSLLVVILAIQKGMNRYLKLSFFAFIIGILLFSFSLYTLAVSGIKIFGAITPFGGASFLLGWIFLGLGTFQSFEEP